MRGLQTAQKVDRNMYCKFLRLKRCWVWFSVEFLVGFLVGFLITFGEYSRSFGELSGGSGAGHKKRKWQVADENKAGRGKQWCPEHI